ncbi:XdhC family protein [Streptomyces sp. NPDC001975]
MHHVLTVDRGQRVGDGRPRICVLFADVAGDRLVVVVGVGGDGGSRRTHDHRLGAPRELGVSEDEPARPRSPIGLDLGAHTPEETAVSITAEIIAHAHQGTGLPLSRGTGPIHRPRRVLFHRPREQPRTTDLTASTGWSGVSRRCRRWTGGWWPRTRGSAEPRARECRVPRSGR